MAHDVFIKYSNLDKTAAFVACAGFLSFYPVF
jgi:hypothetical protein